MAPLKLYTAGTPNGHKVSVFLEELKAAYPDFEYETTAITLRSAEHKEPWFLKINPNGRIPALIDPNQKDFAVFESAAIILYLEKFYDPKHLFSWGSDEAGGELLRSEALQWMFFSHGGIGPMQGQAIHFNRLDQDIPYAKERYTNEAVRLYKVLETRLEGRDFLVGPGKGKFSIADMNDFPMLVFYEYSGLESSALGPNCRAWLNRLLQRDAVKKGLLVPSETQYRSIIDKAIQEGF